MSNNYCEIEFDFEDPSKQLKCVKRFCKNCTKQNTISKDFATPPTKQHNFYPQQSRQQQQQNQQTHSKQNLISLYDSKQYNFENQQEIIEALIAEKLFLEKKLSNAVNIVNNSEQRLNQATKTSNICNRSFIKSSDSLKKLGETIPPLTQNLVQPQNLITCTENILNEEDFTQNGFLTPKKGKQIIEQSQREISVDELDQNLSFSFFSSKDSDKEC